MIVLDNSIAMRWVLPPQVEADAKKARETLTALKDERAIVPSLFFLEAANVLTRAEKRGLITTDSSLSFTELIKSLPIETDERATIDLLDLVVPIARDYALSAYDAAYLELAIHLNLPLATLDEDLIKAARKAKVTIFLAETL
ncbi:MAG: type II toxin-antitoxin system VapC family toxin [Helicobacteraceae bacterium]|jgi:predicted nucleic acid-binding protein|nr:type II toxin-antitoxin system VapC family toxin [Helicobacteraceae bacterium]